MICFRSISSADVYSTLVVELVTTTAHLIFRRRKLCQHALELRSNMIIAKMESMYLAEPLVESKLLDKRIEKRTDELDPVAVKENNTLLDTKDAKKG